MRRLVIALLVLATVLAALNYGAPHTTARALLALGRARAGLTLGEVPLADGRMVYLEGGSGEPLVLVHGFGADKDSFTRVAAHLTPRWHVLIPDLHGFGESARPAGVSYAPAAQVERLRAFLKTLRIERPHLGGNSMGGYIVTEWAARYPDEVASLWLLAPGGTAVAFDSELIRIIQERGENLLLPRTPEDYLRTVAMAAADPPFVPYAVLRVMGERAAADHDLHERIFLQVGPPHVATLDDRLAGITAPSLVVFGTADRLLNPQAAKVYEQAMPHAEVVLMEGIGHVPMLEAPGVAAADYVRFRDGLAAGAAPAGH